MRELRVQAGSASNSCRCFSKIATLSSACWGKPHYSKADKLATDCIHHIRALRRALAARDNYIIRFNVTKPSESEWVSSMKPPISVTELHRIIEQGLTAQQLLTTLYEGLVLYIVKRYQSTAIHGSTLSDRLLMQEGKLGVQEAAYRYNPEKGYKFSNFALFFIRRRILRFMANHSELGPLSADVRKRLKNINETKAKMTIAIGRPPSIPELAQRMNLSVENLAFMEYS
jgi:DNA-directed RNA polymerase sigma subunit (sigma70/sigma32)